jgi:curved DNA-binding protein
MEAMHARALSEVASIAEAHALLGLDGPAEGEALKAAFRRAIKAARPDQPGGDDGQFRRIIAAWGLIKMQGGGRLALPAPRQRPSLTTVIPLSPMQALEGGDASVSLGRRTLNIHVPAGLRTGEHLRLRGAGVDGADLHLPVLIRPTAALRVMGDDLYMRWSVPQRLLDDGGRVEVETHAGLRSAWIIAGTMGPTTQLRLKGLGLPARGKRPQGHLFVALTPCADAPSSAEDLLMRFTRVWTPERIAA